MKTLSVSSLGALALACALVTACGNSEEDVVPQMNTNKPAKAEPAPAPAEEEPQLVPIQSLSDQKEAPAPAAAEEAKPVQAAVLAPSGDVKPLSDGPYVIQVSIQPSKKAADGVVKKLSEQGIEAYVVEVENPGELEGTYYRVRVGYFTSIKMAQDYGKQVLSSLNFAWWVDNSSNDQVGNPSGGDDDTDYSTYYAPAESSQEAAPAAEPEPGGAMDADERTHVAVGAVMNGFGNEPLARTDLPHDKRRQGTTRNLVDLRVHALHLARAPDDVVGLETVLEFERQAFVLGLQEFVFFAGLATELHCRRKHLRDDFEQAQFLGEFIFYRILHVGTEGANHLVFHDDRHAENARIRPRTQ